jgi:cold shock protein
VADGVILRFDDARGYGFIEPADGTEDVFVHANDFGESRHLVRAGLRVRYEVAQSDRGPKVAAVSLLLPPPERERFAGSSVPVAAGPPQPADDEVCDVLTAESFGSAIIELLIGQVPTLSGGEIGAIRRHMTDLARSHGWVDG